MLRQHFLIDAWPAVIPLEEPDGGEPDQVLIADPVFREQHKVRVRRAQGDISRRLLARVPAAEREIGLKAQDRSDVSGFRFGVERPRAVEVAVVGDGERIHTQRLDPIEQIGDPIGAVEERVLAMRVEVNERHGYAAESAVFCAVMQWLMLVVTFIVMALLQRLVRSVGAPLEAHATLALGCVTLAALIAGTIAQRIRIPRVVGYLVAGYVAGPAWLHLIRADDLHNELQVLSPISTGALALIAFAVGSELTLAALRGERRQTVQRIAAATMAVPFLAVAFVVLTVSPWFPLTAHQPFRDAMVVALALGTVAAVSSPTQIWAVITDVHAAGPVSRTTLDVSVVQDLLAVLLVTVILALTLPLGSRGTVRPGVATHTLLILLGSIVAGITVGLGRAPDLRVLPGRLFLVLVLAGVRVAHAGPVVRPRAGLVTAG